MPKKANGKVWQDRGRRDIGVAHAINSQSKKPKRLHGSPIPDNNLRKIRKEQTLDEFNAQFHRSESSEGVEETNDAPSVEDQEEDAESTAGKAPTPKAPHVYKHEIDPQEREEPDLIASTNHGENKHVRRYRPLKSQPLLPLGMMSQKWQHDHPGGRDYRFEELLARHLEEIQDVRGVSIRTKNSRGSQQSVDEGSRHIRPLPTRTKPSISATPSHRRKRKMDDRVSLGEEDELHGTKHGFKGPAIVEGQAKWLHVMGSKEMIRCSMVYEQSQNHPKHALTTKRHPPSHEISALESKAQERGVVDDEVAGPHDE